jgi:hypothetical protein
VIGEAMQGDIPFVNPAVQLGAETEDAAQKLRGAINK